MLISGPRQVVMKSSACPFIVQFYGGVFKEGDCWICMELMDASLDQFYKFVYRRMKQRMPENIIGKIALAVSTAQSLSDILRSNS
jgi:mitogen-activated protein kinase kinase 4